MAKQVALKGASVVDSLLAQPLVDDPKRTVNDRIGEVVGMIRENMKPARMARCSAVCSAVTRIMTAASACSCKSKAPRPIHNCSGHLHAHHRPEPGGGPARGCRSGADREGKRNRQDAGRRDRQARQHRRQDRRRQVEDLVRRERPGGTTVRQGRFQDRRRLAEIGRLEVREIHSLSGRRNWLRGYTATSSVIVLAARRDFNSITK